MSTATGLPLFVHSFKQMGALLLLFAGALAQSDSGSYDEAAHLYRNRAYAITCKVPAGWVLRTEQLKTDTEAAKNSGAHQVLLAAFERPPEATGPTPASTILIATESQSAYPGLKTAEDYLAPLSEVVTAKGFKSVNDPYQFPIGSVHVLREDFSREQNDRPTMYQTTLVMLTRGAILSFTFLAASEDEVDNLIENLSLSPRAAKSTPKTPARKKANSPQNRLF